MEHLLTCEICALQIYLDGYTEQLMSELLELGHRIVAYCHTVFFLPVNSVPSSVKLG